MKQIFSWEDEEIKTLFKYVEVKKSDGVPLITIFANFAKCVGREQNSVRNFYYTALKKIKLNSKLCEDFGVNLNVHSAKQIKSFTKSQTSELINKVDKLIDCGFSVRGACLKLANGDATKMIRIQNKYRSQNKQKKDSSMGNIIKMPVKNIMSDEDINALFLGLLKLVKKQEEDRARFKVQAELETANEKLKNALKEIVIRRAEIEKLQSEISLLKKASIQKTQMQIKNRVKELEHKKAKDLISDFVASKNTKQRQMFIKN